MSNLKNLKHAVVREPGLNFPSCISSHPLRHTINLTKALNQHSYYCEVLESFNLKIVHLPSNEFPDSCFVEDNAVIQDKRALITRMGVEARRGEEKSIENVLKDYMEIKRAVTPATIEGGDVIHLSDRLVCGLTQRTNTDGVDQMRNWLNVTVDLIVDPNIIHLKSYVTYLGKGYVIATKTYVNHPILKNFKVLIIDEDEGYAANTLTIENTVLMPTGFPKTQSMLRDNDFDVITLEMSEFQKCEGALTCLSLLF